MLCPTSQDATLDSVYALGRIVPLRSDWEAVKLKVMLRGAKLKYDQHPHLKSALLSTAGRITFTRFISTLGWCFETPRLL